MKRYLVRVEAVNFSEIIFDTNDISTIRGGGLTALRLGKMLEEWAKSSGCETPELLLSGASQAAVMLSSSVVADALEESVRKHFASTGQSSDGPPYDLLTLTVGAVGLAPDNVADALVRAEARCRSQRFRRWTVAELPFSKEARFPSAFDGNRPVKLLEGVHASTERRRAFGKDNRQCFYNDIASGYHYSGGIALDRQDRSFPYRNAPNSRPQATRLGFVDSFQDMVSDPPPVGKNDPLPPSLQSSIAVFYVDGNKFGAAVKAAGPQAFEKAIKPLRETLIRNLLEWLKSGMLSENWQRYAVLGEDETLHARFETLMWGGEEMLFVMPSWLAMEFVEKFFKWTKDWTVEEIPLSHAVGVAIAHHKVPIRQLRNIAAAAADGAKDHDVRDAASRHSDPLKPVQPLRACNSVTFEIFESHHPPDDGIDALREGAYGSDPDLPIKLAFTAKAFAETRRKVSNLQWGDTKREPFPRSQLYGLCRAIRKNSFGFVSSCADDHIKGELDKYFNRAGEGRGWQAQDLRLPGNGLSDTPKDGTFKGCSIPSRNPALDLALIVQLWDYVDPFNVLCPEEIA